VQRVANLHLGGQEPHPGGGVAEEAVESDAGRCHQQRHRRPRRRNVRPAVGLKNLGEERDQPGKRRGEDRQEAQALRPSALAVLLAQVPADRRLRLVGDIVGEPAATGRASQAPTRAPAAARTRCSGSAFRAFQVQSAGRSHLTLPNRRRIFRASPMSCFAEGCSSAAPMAGTVPEAANVSPRIPTLKEPDTLREIRHRLGQSPGAEHDHDEDCASSRRSCRDLATLFVRSGCLHGVASSRLRDCRRPFATAFSSLSTQETGCCGRSATFGRGNTATHFLFHGLARHDREIFSQAAFSTIGQVPNYKPTWPR
jgi:hypothetical protein